MHFSSATRPQSLTNRRTKTFCCPFQMNQMCKVCGEPAAGFHFGAFTCEGCKVSKAKNHQSDHLNVLQRFSIKVIDRLNLSATVQNFFTHKNHQFVHVVANEFIMLVLRLPLTCQSTLRMTCWSQMSAKVKQSPWCTIGSFGSRTVYCELMQLMLFVVQVITDHMMDR